VIVALLAMVVVADYEINPNVVYTVNGVECFRRDIFVLEITERLNKQQFVFSSILTLQS
jgi:hypothetical protein